jgi:beta-lactamase class A
MSLQEKLLEIVNSAQGTFGVYVKHLQSGESASINGDRLFQAASVFKIPILATLMRDVAEGRTDLNKRIRLAEHDIVPGSGVFKELDHGAEITVKDLATMMIIVSDNLATDQILSIVGKDRVEQYMAELGLTQTFVKFNCWELLSLYVGLEPESYSQDFFQKINSLLNEGKMDENSIVYQESTDNNVTSPIDMGRLLEQIATSNPIPGVAARQVFDILTKQQLRNRIPRLLPKGTILGCKSGTLGSVINDCGIVHLPDQRGQFVIAVFSTGNPTVPTGEGIIANLASSTYQHFIGK